MENLYKKRFPRRNVHQRTTDLLRMSKPQFDQFQGAAKQFLGESVLHPNLKRPRNKLLPSSLHTIKNVTHPGTLAALIHMQKLAHNDPNKDFHEGGGSSKQQPRCYLASGTLLGLGQNSTSGSIFLTMTRLKTKSRKMTRSMPKSFNRVTKTRMTEFQKLGTGCGIHPLGTTNSLCG